MLLKIPSLRAVQSTAQPPKGDVSRNPPVSTITLHVTDLPRARLTRIATLVVNALAPSNP